jgi:hypothetical protein
MYRILFTVFLCSPLLLAQEASFVPPLPTDNNAAFTSTAIGDKFLIASRDSVLGDRIAKISANLDRLPQNSGQMWREFDITPHTQGRKISAGSIPPEQMLTDWILRQTGTARWHTAPFSVLTADTEKL